MANVIEQRTWKVEPVQVFWTGGWDSTFRVLQALLVEKRSVQPHYVIDVFRRSTNEELKAMHRIRQALFKKFPFTAELLLSTTYVESGANENPEVDKAYAEVTRTSNVTSQCRWLSSYASAISTRIEMASEHTETPKANGLQNTLASHLIEVEGTGEAVLNPQLKGSALYTLLGNFSFPLLTYSKAMMAEIAGKEGFADIMDLTWFCHRPWRGSQPCGVCVPCSIVIREGMQYRLPWKTRLRRFFHKKYWAKRFKVGAAVS